MGVSASEKALSRGQLQPRVWILVIIVSLAIAALLGSGCDRSIAEPDAAPGDTSDAEGVPAELAVQFELTPSQCATGDACQGMNPSILSTSGGGRIDGFCLTQIAAVRSLLIEKDFVASPTRSQRDLRGHNFFALSWHPAARNYV